MLGWINTSREYISAAKELNVGETLTGPTLLKPLLQLLGIGLESALKADLLFQGQTEEKLQAQFGHHLTKLYAAADTERRLKAEQLADERLRRSWGVRREAFLKDKGEFATLYEIPTAAQLVAGMPSLQSVVDGLGPLYASSKGLRYFQPLLFQLSVARLPPYDELAATKLALFAKALTDCLEQELRPIIRAGA